jgi:AcrR family transcriptional regulator
MRLGVTAMPSQDKSAPRMPAAERRKQILSTARQMILCNGIGTLNMSAIADAIGVAKPIVYKHFRNSEDVIVALLHEYMDGTVRVVAKKITNIESLSQFFNIVIEELFTHIKDYGPLVRNVTSGFSSSSKIDACVRRLESRALRVYRYLLIQQGLANKQATFAAYALSSMISNSIYEYAEANDADHRATLKAMVLGSVNSLVKSEGVRPDLPDDILDDTDDGRDC